MNNCSFLSECEDCSKMVNFLLSSGNNELVISDHEDIPLTVLRYKGYMFTLNYKDNQFARLVLSGTEVNVDDGVPNILLELGSIIGVMIGEPTLYYNAVNVESDLESMFPTLEWCIDSEIVNDYISAVVNGELFTDKECINVQLFGGRKVENYKKSNQLSLKKYL